MKIAVILLLALVPLAAADVGTRCSMQHGNEMVQFSGRELRVKAPCKFHAIFQKCGDYRVWVTPGMTFLFPRYFINTIWLGVTNVETGKFWEGRTTNKLTALRIIKGDKRAFFNQKQGNYTTEELFDVTSTTQNVTLKAKDGSFSLTVGAYDFSGNKHDDSTLEFVCHVENTPSNYPDHFCGSSGDGKEIKDRAETVFGSKKDVDLLVLFDMFNDTNVVQTQEGCIEGNRVMTEVCSTDPKRKEAIEICHQILDSNAHTKCVRKYACDPLDVFVNCMKYVCSDYEDKAACEVVGQAIDLCRNFHGLTSRVKEANCYKDLMTAEDNPYYEE